LGQQTDAMMPGYHTRSILTAPLHQDGKTVGAIQVTNKKIDQDGSGSVFTECDEKVVQLLGSQIASFLRIVKAGK
jgi:GAF domain-containing protein